jgi:hypothetical protein
MTDEEIRKMKEKYAHVNIGRRYFDKEVKNICRHLKGHYIVDEKYAFRSHLLYEYRLPKKYFECLQFAYPY